MPPASPKIILCLPMVCGDEALSRFLLPADRGGNHFENEKCAAFRAAHFHLISQISQTYELTTTLPKQST